MNRWRPTVLLALFLLQDLRADTVTLHNNRSYSGTVVQLGGGEIAMQLGPSRKETFKLADVSELEFNDVYENSGSPPALGVNPKDPPKKPAPKSPTEKADKLFLEGGQSVTCQVTSIDTRKQVKCGGRSYDNVYKILFKGR